MDENDVIFAVCAHLGKTGHRIHQRLSTTQQGIDVIAQHAETGQMVYVEAKGGTSSRADSNRYGRPYDSSQIFDRVAKGVFTVLQLRERYPDQATASVVLALPDSDAFRKQVTTVASVLGKSGVQVLLVREDNQASVLPMERRTSQ